MGLKISIQDMLWVLHRVGDTYTMDDQPRLWKIVYYSLPGTYKGGKWIEFEEPRALIESPMEGGTDFREVPLRYLKRASEKYAFGIKQYKQPINRS